MHPKNETVIKLKSNVVWIFLYDQKAELALLRQSKQLCMPIFQFPKPQNIELSWLFTLYGLILEICQVFLVGCSHKGYLKAIHFENSVCTIFSLRKQGTPHQTFPSQPELTSAASLRKQGTYMCRHCLQNEWTLVKEFFQ